MTSEKETNEPFKSSRPMQETKEGRYGTSPKDKPHVPPEISPPETEGADELPVTEEVEPGNVPAHERGTLPENRGEDPADLDREDVEPEPGPR